MVSASETILKILEDMNMSKKQLAKSINITEQNFGNKIKRDTFSSKDLVEIGLKTGFKLAFIDKDIDCKYPIEYDLEDLFKPKRKPDGKTKEERQKIAHQSVETRLNNQKKANENS